MQPRLHLQTILFNIMTGLFILLFTYAGVSKLFDYQKFSVELGKSPMLTSFAGFVAWSVPALEILLSILLLVPSLQYKAMYACYMLMTMFTAYLITTLQFSDYVPCTCGGVLQQLTWQTHIVFNICFMAMAVFAILLHKK
jgi:uncharacterized membrane protein YphA (DoxX/SURF4 family)